jgi:hypothetical protein
LAPGGSSVRVPAYWPCSAVAGANALIPAARPAVAGLLLIVALGFHDSLFCLFCGDPAAGRAVGHVRRSMPRASSRRNRTAEV